MRLGALGVSATLVAKGAVQVFDLRRIPGKNLRRKGTTLIVAGRCSRCLFGTEVVGR